MKIASLIARYLLALIFLVFGINHYLNFISTGPMCMIGPGIFAPNRSDTPSSGWIDSTSRLVSRFSTGVSRNNWNGARLNCMAISVVRPASRLPVRK